jgi:hypothetical protein
MTRTPEGWKAFVDKYCDNENATDGEEFFREMLADLLELAEQLRWVFLQGGK